MEKVKSDNLIDDIESGRYFDMARDWSISKYLNIYTQALYLLIVVIIAILGAYMASHISITRYMAVKYPFVAYTDDQVNYFTKIEALSQKDSTIDQDVARYLLKQYVIRREEYSYDGYLDREVWGEKTMFLQKNSSRKVYSAFLDYIDTKENSESPVLKYRAQVDRQISIKDVIFDPPSQHPFAAKILFDSIEVSPSNKATFHCNAYLEFNITDIKKVLDKKVDLKFLVTTYNSSCS